jgi:hypothetical protein
MIREGLQMCVKVFGREVNASAEPTRGGYFSAALSLTATGLKSAVSWRSMSRHIQCVT